MSSSARLALAAAAAFLAIAPAQAQTRYRAISVDTTPIAARGYDALAANIRASLQADLARSFADRMTTARNAPVLVVKITAIQRAALPDGRGGSRRSFSGGGGQDNDYLEGEALVVSNHRVISSHPMLSSLDSTYAGAWYQKDGEQKRLQALTWHYAYWLRREIGNL